MIQPCKDGVSSRFSHLKDIVPVSQASPAIVWFRHDLRIGDNPALNAAALCKAPVLAVYVYEQTTPELRPFGAAANWWLHGALHDLDHALRSLGNGLIVLNGRAETLIPALATGLQAKAVFWNRRYGKAEIAADSAIKAKLKANGIDAESHNGALLYEPWTVTNKEGGPMKVFTPYWRTARASGEPASPLPAPAKLVGFPDAHQRIKALSSIAPALITLADLQLEPTKPDWAKGFHAHWRRGEDGAKQRLAQFLEQGFAGYAQQRNRPDIESTSRLSAHLRFGEISIRQVWHTTCHAYESGQTGASSEDLRVFQSELGWREFAHHLLYHNPDLATRNYQPRFDAFPWADRDESLLKAWQMGQTGYPIVDAGMRQLWQTGWMHNRVRMVVGSFLVKHLLIDWRRGEEWFWDTLVDACPANNPASWQWVAGSGADAAPYFRIFNPISQGETFDPDGDYVRHYCPELTKLPNSLIHKPWTADAATLKNAGLVLGQTYPKPIINHEAGRERALRAF
jgi:deoxyribodipyrimidine photo-lyase